MSQLEYSKLILSKTQFYPEIFWKEYQKFRLRLRASSGDLRELDQWVKQQQVVVLVNSEKEPG